MIILLINFKAFCLKYVYGVSVDFNLNWDWSLTHFGANSAVKAPAGDAAAALRGLVPNYLKRGILFLLRQGQCGHNCREDVVNTLGHLVLSI